MSLVPLVYQAAEAQASAQALQPAAAAAPVEDNRPWQDFRYATLEEVKAELVRARGQVFKIQHDTWMHGDRHTSDYPEYMSTQFPFFMP